MAKLAAIPEERLALYEQLVGTHPEVERKGASMPYTSLNGNMFSFLSPEGELALRLGASERAAFLERHGAALMEQHGAVMKEYVRVPDALLDDARALATYFALSLEYAKTLKPKATTRVRR